MPNEKEKNKGGTIMLAAIIIGVAFLFFGFMNKISIVEVDVNISIPEVTGDLNMKEFDIINATNIQAEEFIGELNWSYLKNYPEGCDQDEAVQVINDTLTCVNLQEFNNSQNISSIIDIIDEAWVNLSINRSDAYFKWNNTDSLLELWVNDVKQHAWGGSQFIFGNATFFGDAFFQNIFMENAGGDGIILLGSMFVVGDITTNSTFFGDGSGLVNVCLSNGTGCNQSFINSSDLNITFPSGRAGEPPWLYNDSTTIFFNETHFNNSVQELAEVNVYEENISVTVSSGTGEGQSATLIGFEITRITVFTPTASSTYRFQAVQDSNGDIIDRDRGTHRGIWDIEKSYAINNDYVNVSIFNANTDGNYTVRLIYLDNFRP